MSGCRGDPSLCVMKTAPLGMTREPRITQGPSTCELMRARFAQDDRVRVRLSFSMRRGVPLRRTAEGGCPHMGSLATGCHDSRAHARSLRSG